MLTGVNHFFVHKTKSVISRTYFNTASRHFVRYMSDTFSKECHRWKHSLTPMAVSTAHARQVPLHQSARHLLSSQTCAPSVAILNLFLWRCFSLAKIYILPSDASKVLYRAYLRVQSGLLIMQGGLFYLISQGQGATGILPHCCRIFIIICHNYVRPPKR